MSGDEIKELIKGKPPTRDNFDDEEPTGSSEPSSSVPNTGSNLKPKTQTIT